MTLSWPLSRQQVLDLNGRPMLDARARFFEAGTTTPLTVFSDAGRTQPHAQPVAPDATGRFPRVFLPDGQYAEQVFSASAGELWYDGALGAPVVTPDPTDPEAPTDASSYFRTGDVKWRLDGAILPGWVRMNARTIGSAASGSSERSNADTQALYTYLWQTFSDGIAPVVGGRGGGAVNDFSAGKQIVIPTMQGLVAAGVDTMGSTAAGRLQTIVQVALTAGSNVVEVSDRSRISIGMLLLSEGVSAGTVVTGIDGNKVRLNQAVASTGSFVGRFSLLADAQTYGCLGGDALFLVEKANLPVELPGSSIRVEYPSQKGVKYTTLASVQAGNLQNVTNLWQSTEDYLTTPPDPKDYAITIRNDGGGVPHPTLQPMRLGTFYLKL